MPTKAEVGQRIRLARFRHDMTLKEVATKSGMSATHISEIERGKTSPTIGALQRIAKALGERPAHFVEERFVSPASLIRRNERINQYVCDVDGRTITFELLTAPNPWGSIHAVRKLSAPGDAYRRPPGPGEIVTVCVEGMIRVTTGSDSHVLRDGDTIQLPLDQGFLVENIGEDRAETISFACHAAPGPW